MADEPVMTLARSNGCGAPIYWRPEIGQYYCMKCSRPLIKHPQDAGRQAGWHWLELQEDGVMGDEWSELLRIMEP